MKTPENLLTLTDKLFQEKATWPELIKEIRKISGVDIFGAEKIALSHQGWRRLCKYYIDHNPDCKKQAIRHIKHHGSNSLLALRGGIFVVVTPEEA